ncbi:VOC family protein [Gulosibacter molinativorax]|nr:VOC family protein [Gulosibacter molinativorax]QUY63442.1 Glyoxalase/bleomycin resistance protein/dioxygenase [Gulosibacter molinativorax]
MSIFLNIPTSDVERSKVFFTAIGWSVNPNFSDENAVSVEMSDGQYLMALHRDYYQTFIGDKTVGDPATQSLALIAFDLDSREAVDAFLETVGKAGGKVGKIQDHGFMYGGQFDDPDGNHFEPFWMDPEAAAGGPPAA